MFYKTFFMNQTLSKILAKQTFFKCSFLIITSFIFYIRNTYKKYDGQFIQLQVIIIEIASLFICLQSIANVCRLHVDLKFVSLKNTLHFLNFCESQLKPTSWKLQDTFSALDFPFPKKISSYDWKLYHFAIINQI